MLERIIQLLESLAKRPQFYVAPVEIATIQSYLQGLRGGCMIAGLLVTNEIVADAATSRGWRFCSIGYIWHLKEKNLTDEQIIQEMIAVEIEAYRMAATKDKVQT